MKGWRPSACPWLETGIGLGKAGVSHAERRIDWPVFFREVLGPRAHDPGIRGRRGSLFALIGSAAAESDKRRPSVRDHEKAPALHFACLPAGGAENEDEGTDEQLGERATPILPRRFKPELASKIKNASGGQRKSLKKLDSAKEMRRHFEFGFRSAGFGICSAWLGFRSEKFGYRSGGFGFPSSRRRVGLLLGPSSREIPRRRSIRRMSGARSKPPERHRSPASGPPHHAISAVRAAENQRPKRIMRAAKARLVEREQREIASSPGRGGRCQRTPDSAPSPRVPQRNTSRWVTARGAVAQPPDHQGVARPPP